MVAFLMKPVIGFSLFKAVGPLVAVSVAFE